MLHYTKKLTISITGLHNKPQGCGASVASAAGTFTKKTRIVIVKKIIFTFLMNRVGFTNNKMMNIPGV
jgi:hypothetical protein